MNTDLQQQTDLLIKAVHDLETTLHQDIIMLLIVLFSVGIAILIVIVFGVGRR